MDALTKLREHIESQPRLPGARGHRPPCGRHVDVLGDTILEDVLK